jgi:multidrug efflux pump subunit AcrB
MVGLLVATVTFTVLVALLLAVLVAVTVLPVFVSLQMADVRRFSTARWFGVSAVGVLLGLAIAYLLHKHGVSRFVQPVPLVLTWIGPAMLWLLEERQVALGGRAGRHE